MVGVIPELPETGFFGNAGFSRTSRRRYKRREERELGRKERTKGNACLGTCHTLHHFCF